MSAKNRKYYRIGFRDTTPTVETVIEVGTNRQGKHPIFFVAPLNEHGGTEITQIRSVQADAHGNPNGYYASVEEAREAVAHQLGTQIERMQAAKDAVLAVEETPAELVAVTA